jgi:1-acyl-sn-glycerol-3-phosphate acyltransferase
MRQFEQLAAPAGNPAPVEGTPGVKERRLPWWRFVLSCTRSLLYFIPLIFLATAGFGLWSLAVSVFEASGRRQHAIARHWARTLLRIAGVRVTVTGREYLSRGGSCVLVANHLSYMDTPVVFAELPMQFRILARRWLFSIPCLGWHLRRSMHLPIAADVSGSVRSLLRAAEHVRHGLPVFIFPEGGRSHQGQLQAFRGGAFLLAIRAHVPVIPMVLVGTREVLRYGSLHIRPGCVCVHVLPPISTTDLSSREVERLSTDVRSQILAVLQHVGGPSAPS